MIANYFNDLHQVSPLSMESRKALSKHISVKKIPRGQYILKYEEICKHIYYVNKGLIRIFYYKNGKDITEWFADERQFFFSIISYFEQKGSQLIIETLEDSEIIFLSKEGQDALRKVNLEIANLIIQSFTYSLILSQKRMESLQFESAAKRYQNMLKDHPGIINKAPLQHVASFLGITQETLSRIRSSL